MEPFGPLVQAGWLAEHAADPDLRIVDLRWYLDGRSGRDAYRRGHIPGAVFVDLDSEITGKEGPGRHPLPSPEDFQAAMRRAGVNRQSRVVVYDDAGGFSGARLWWLLRRFGHSRVAVLDGGLQLWPGELETGEAEMPAGDYLALAPEPGQVLDREAVRTRGSATVLLDARAGERFRGETEPMDPRAGHIPGAINAYWQENLGPDGRFLPAGQLRARYVRLGVEAGEQVVAYCGSGVSAIHDLLALEVAGLGGGRLYEGSWSDWSRHPELPAETGT
jgi:thiosulfate/3-mercaptopyruvate sulfurtransferase